jgi:hypothetical protein
LLSWFAEREERIMTKKVHAASAVTKPQKLSDADQVLLISYPVHAPAEVKSYVKPAEGLDRVGPIAAKFLEDNPAIATALKLDPALLRQELADATALDGPTATAYALYRRGYENAMEKRSDVTRAIFKLNRFVQNSDDQEQARAFVGVSDWVSATHGHGAAADPTADPAPAAPPAGSSTGTSTT